MSDLSACKAVIIIFAMDGCHHCHDYLPKFDRQLNSFREYQAPIAYYQGGPIAHGMIPVIILDGASSDPEISALADQHKVSGMPTTLLLTRRGIAKHEGALEDREIYDLLAAAVHANR